MNRGFRGGDAAEPVAVLQAAIQQLAQRDQQAHEPAPAERAQPAVEVPQFIPADYFQGARQGYYFGTGDEGTGYYRDEQQELEPEAAAGRTQLDPEELLRQAEQQAEAAEVQLMDEKGLRKMLNAFEKRAKENLELRMKYADEPMKFIENEVDLLSMLRGLAQVAADPNTLYPILIDSPAVSTLAGLLTHDNTDIAVEVLDLLEQLTDADEEEDNEAVAGALVDALNESNFVELLVERLTKFNEKVDEEAAAVNNALAVIEHAVELRPQLAVSVLEKTKLLKWLLARLKVKGSDSNKQYASELLAILMQGHESNQALLGKSNGIDVLLVCLAGFKSKEPADELEHETMENMFDALCSCLLLPANRSAFVELEGVELMHLLLKGKKSSRYGAIKAIDFATTRSPPACDRLVEAGALAQLFAILMGRSKIKNIKGEAGDRDVVREVEERCISIISNLFQGVTKTSRKERLAAKFVEAEFEKVDRLMEIAFRYADTVAAVEARLASEAELIDEEVDEDELSEGRHDAGLFTLQCCMVITAALWSTGDTGLRRRLLACLHQRAQTLEMVRGVLREYYFSLGDEGAMEERQRQLQRLSQLLAGLGVDIAAEVAERGGIEAVAAADAVADADGEQAPGSEGEADMDLEEEARPPLPPDEDYAGTAQQQQKQQIDHQHGNGVSEQQQRQQQLSPPPDRQQQQHKREAAAVEPAAKQRSSGDRGKRGDEAAAARDRDRDRDRHKEKEEERDRHRDRPKDRDRGERGDKGEQERERGDRDRGDKDRERSDRDRDRERRAKDRDKDSRSRRRSRSLSRSRSKSPHDKREDAHRHSSSSKHKRRRRSRSTSR